MCSFAWYFYGSGVPLNQLICQEGMNYRGSMNQKGDFCEKVMDETYFGQKYYWWQFHQ
ncbi:MAG: hypothetical protein K6E94_07340 [Elusimicrobiaceae bacterium]|nr:hypothetical protein [Elusimicrobiaceae bacterium]